MIVIPSMANKNVFSYWGEKHTYTSFQWGNENETKIYEEANCNRGIPN